MVYNIPAMKSTGSMQKKCSEQVEELHTECVKIREKIKKRQELS